MTDQPRYSSLRDYLRVLRSQAWLIILATLIGGGIAAYFSFRQPDTYSATARIAFEDENTSLNTLGIGSTGTQTPLTQTPQARTATIRQPATVGAVRKRLGTHIQVGRLQAAVSTSLNSEDALVDVTAEWGDPGFAARVANAFAQTASARINQRTRRDFERIRADIQARIKRLGPSEADQAELAALAEARSRLDFLIQTARPATVVQAAKPSATPISPKPIRNTGLGLILGFTVGIVAAFLRDSLDRRLRTAADVQDAIPYPIIGHVRNEALGKVIRAADGMERSVQENLEAIRIISQNIEFLDIDAKPRLIVVTSGLAEEGKSTVAASLACVNAGFGKSTLLIECDLRRPALAERLNLQATPGLSDHLMEQTGVKGVFQRVDIGPTLPIASIDGVPGTGGVGRLECVTAGTLTPQPAEVLKSKRFRTFLEAARANYDSVIVDTSPLLPVVDTLELLPSADCVLLCVRANQSTRDQLEATRNALEHLPRRPTGVVVTGLRRSDAANYGYYSYGKAYRAASGSATPVAS